MATAVRTEFAKEALAEPCTWPTFEALDETVRAARRTATDARHAAEDFAAGAALKVRRRPFAAVGAALTMGAFAGVLVGFVAGWLAKARE